MAYDHAGRLLNTSHKIGEQEKIQIVAHRYDDRGQLIEKRLHSTNEGDNFLQNVDYRYNIRGWLTDINDINFSGLIQVKLAAETYPQLN